MMGAWKIGMCVGMLALGLGGAAEGAEPVVKGAAQAEGSARPLSDAERFEDAVQRLALRPEQVAPFKAAMQGHRDAQRALAETHQVGKGDWKERRQGMMANTRTLRAELDEILTPVQVEIFNAWWAERKQAAR